MTVRDISLRLKEAGIPDHMYESRLLMSFFSGKSTASLLADPGFDLSSEELETAVRRRCGRYPLQYIIGSWEFCGLTFEVDENCLIPRQDTEVIVEYALKTAGPDSEVLDLCTGTGCILASVLKLSGNFRGTAVELLPGAAAVAGRNFSRLGLDCRLITGDIRRDLLGPGDMFDIITCNPPYIDIKEMPSLQPELAFDPESALTDGGDGLSLIEAAVSNYSPHLKSTGVMVIEHGYDQSEKVSAIARRHGLESEVILDYGGRKRGAALRHKE